jgi:hypothetical protein
VREYLGDRDDWAYHGGEVIVTTIMTQAHAAGARGRQAGSARRTVIR